MGRGWDAGFQGRGLESAMALLRRHRLKTHPMFLLPSSHCPLPPGSAGTNAGHVLHSLKLQSEAAQHRTMLNTHSISAWCWHGFTLASSAQNPPRPPVTQTLPALPGTALAWPCRWHFWPGEAADGDSAWCSHDLSQAHTALVQT